ncbi:hypothetical protein [uncultured Shewanella sp.]|uniref:hypothetical protein n=1 Tax=uncultured Shewanella sp. TaxID=173975 RepID=UPI0026099988|nr:hypothetical protein [uncultured Shewanella sp.]
MAGIQLGGGEVTHNTWDKNYISAAEISHINNMTKTEKIWDWLCDTVCGTHRAEAKEYIRQLDVLSNDNTPDMVGLKKELFTKLTALTSNDYTQINRSNGQIEYQIGYFKGHPDNHEVVSSWSRPALDEYQCATQKQHAEFLKKRLVQSFNEQIKGLVQVEPSISQHGIEKAQCDSELNAARRLVEPVPVYIAHSHCFGKLLPPLHAYIMTGEPGTQHARLYGERNDLTRSKVELNDTFMSELSKAKYVTKSSDGTKIKVPFEAPILKAISALKGESFAFLDGFVEAIKTELKKTDNEDLLTESHRRGLGYVAVKCNEQPGFYNTDSRKGRDYNEDIHNFEHRKGSVKQQAVKLTTLQEVTREQRIYQDYLDEKLGLNGLEQTKASILTKAGQTVLSEVEKKDLKAQTMVAYSVLPSDNAMEANCNRMAGTYLEAAINREKGLPIDVYQEVQSGTKWALGVNTRSHIHNPLQSQKVTMSSVGEQEFLEIQQRHPHVIVQDEHSMVLGKKQAEDLESQNSQDTGYQKVRSWVDTLSNVRSLFSSKS